MVFLLKLSTLTLLPVSLAPHLGLVSFRNFDILPIQTLLRILSNIISSQHSPAHPLPYSFKISTSFTPTPPPPPPPSQISTSFTPTPPSSRLQPSFTPIPPSPPFRRFYPHSGCFERRHSVYLPPREVRSLDRDPEQTRCEVPNLQKDLLGIRERLLLVFLYGSVVESALDE